MAKSFSVASVSSLFLKNHFESNPLRKIKKHSFKVHVRLLAQQILYLRFTALQEAKLNTTTLGILLLKGSNETAEYERRILGLSCGLI